MLNAELGSATELPEDAKIEDRVFETANPAASTLQHLVKTDSGVTKVTLQAAAKELRDGWSSF